MAKEKRKKRIKSHYASADNPHNLPLQLRLLRRLFAILGYIAPGIGLRLAFALFRTPRRLGKEKTSRTPAGRAFSFQVEEKRIAARSWGDGPLVLLVHGWEGHGLQLHAFVTPLLEKGYKVVTFDAPAHGQSHGRRTNMLEICDTLLTLQELFGKPHAIIAHSFGAACAVVACSRGLKPGRMVTISAPASIDYALKQFAGTLNLSAELANGIRNSIEEMLQLPVSELNPARVATGLNIPALLVHDKDDPLVSYDNALQYQQAWRHSRLLTTHNLGHNRILRDPGTIGQVTAFVHSDN